MVSFILVYINDQAKNLSLTRLFEDIITLFMLQQILMT